MKKGNIPNSWEFQKIGEFSDVVTGGTPNTKHPEYFEGGVKWLKSGDITGLYIVDTSEKISELGLKNSAAKLHPPNGVAIALSGRGKTRGMTSIVRSEMSCSQSVAIIYPKVNVIPEYLHYSLRNQYLKIRNLTGDKSRSGLNLELVRGISILIPPLVEQRAISELLTTVDECIHYTDLVIEKTEELKRGLIQQILTKGIGHSAFKETAIGKIPQKWDIKKFKQITENGSQNGLYKSDDKGTPVNYVRMTELFKSDILTTDIKETVKVTEIELERFGLKAGDLLFGRRSLKVEGAGKCVYVSKLFKDAVFESSIIRFSLKKEVAYPLFFLYWFTSEQGCRSIRRIVRIVTVSGVTGKDLENLKVPVPSLDEQRRISKILSNLDSKIKHEKNFKRKLKMLKKGLLQILLTGKVRVELGEDGLHRIRNS